MIGVNLIICNRRDHPEWRRATEVMVYSLLNSDLVAHPHWIVAIDNGSDDGTPQWLGHSLLKGEVYGYSTNLGIAVARNAATQRLMAFGADVIVEVHNDMCFPRVWLTPLLQALDADPRLGIACPRLITPRGIFGSPPVGIDYAEPPWKIAAHVTVEAALHARPGDDRRGLQHPCAKRAAMLRQIGLYDEEYRGTNYEDTDEVYRAHAAGWGVRVIGASVVWHHYAMSRVDLSPDYTESFVRNRERFYQKFPDAREWEMHYQLDLGAMYA